VCLPAAVPGTLPRNVFQVVNRCFRSCRAARKTAGARNDLVIAPDVRGVGWNDFGDGPRLVQAGEAAAVAALPEIQEWFTRVQSFAAPGALLSAEMAN
jgi:hypothetical protein